MHSESKLDLDYYENIILFNALLSQEYLASIVEHTDISYFNDKNIKIIFKSILQFFKDRGSVPTLTEVKSRLTAEEERKAFNEIAIKLKQIDTKFNREELLVNTERFLKERCLYNTIVKTAEKFAHGKVDPGETLGDFEKAYAINLSDDMGHWYFEEIDEHIKELTTTYKAIPTGWRLIDDKCEGGLFSKTLTVFAGQSNVGKSIVLGNIATNMVLADKNVLLISLEMSEFMYSKRISSQLTQIPHNDLKTYTSELKEQLQHIHKNINSRLIVKEYPPKSITVRHIDAYITKLIHKGFKPDILIVDYINLLMPTTKNQNSYTEVKEISEQLRALSFKYNIPTVSATQLQRGGYNTSSPGMENIAECIEVNQLVTLRDGTKKKIKDVEFGDQIKTNDGFKTVTQVHHKKIKPCYKIKLKSGKEIIVSDKHKFPTNRGRISIVEGLRTGDKLNSIVCKKQNILLALMKRLSNIFTKGGAKNG